MFDELEDALDKAAAKVEAVKRVTFAATPSDPSSSPVPSAQTKPARVNSDDSISISAATIQTNQSNASSLFSGDGYDPSVSSSYVGTTSTGAPPQRPRRLSGLQKAGVWWKNVATGSRPPQRPPVGTRTRPVRESPIPSLSHKSMKSDSKSTMSGKSSGTGEDGFVTAPEYMSSEDNEDGYHTATSKLTMSDQEYFTATEN